MWLRLFKRLVIDIKLTSCYKNYYTYEVIS